MKRRIVLLCFFWFQCWWLRVQGDDSNLTLAESASDVSEIIETKLRSSTSSPSSSEPATHKDEGKLYDEAAVIATRDGSKTDEMVVIEINPAFGATFLDAASMALALVLAAIIFPLAMAYRVSSTFRHAIQAISAKSQPFRLKKFRDEDPMLKLSSARDATVFRPQLLSVAATGGKTYQSILSSDEVSKLLNHLPFHLTAKDWQLLYASEIHGYSLHSAYRRASASGPCVVVCKDTHRAVFGAFCSESLKPNGATYFGNGECWVATFQPRFQVFKWIPGNSEQFVLATDTFLAFGGGGTFAFWLDAQFDRGTSEANKTFGNATHLSSTESFEISAIEIWGFASPSLMSRTSKAFKTVSVAMGVIASKSSFGTTSAKE